MNLVEQFDCIFNPGGVAVVGASANQEKVGYFCLRNLIEAGYKGRIYPVNPRLAEVLGLKAYPSVRAIPGEVDLALVVIPAEAAVSAVEDCVARGVKGVIMITGGFRELGTEAGLALQDRIKDMADGSGTRIIGPNTIGLVNPRINLNATFQRALGSTKAGSVAVVTQSGGMYSLIIRSLTTHNVGISKATGLGNGVDVDFGELLAYFGQDDETELVVMYVEGLEQPRRFMSVAREVVKRKPVLVLKGGRSEQLNRATLSHTGALAGRYELYRAAFAQAGVMVVDDVTELIDQAKALAFQPPAPGNRVAIVSSMGGPSIVAADGCHKLGLKLAEFSEGTWQRLRRLVPHLTPVDNPVDIPWITSEYDVCREILAVIMEDSGVDAVIACVVPSNYSEGFTRAAIEIARSGNKPITQCAGPRSEMSEAQVNLLEENRIPTYPLPGRAVTAMSGLVRYGEILRAAG